MSYPLDTATPFGVFRHSMSLTDTAGRTRFEHWEIHSESRNVECITEPLVIRIELRTASGFDARYKTLPRRASIAYATTEKYHVLTFVWKRDESGKPVSQRTIWLRKRGDAHDDALPMRIKADQI